MKRSTTVKFLTRCGCSRFLEVRGGRGGLPPYFYLPLSSANRAMTSLVMPCEPTVYFGEAARAFKLTHFHVDGQAIPVYVEEE